VGGETAKGRSRGEKGWQKPWREGIKRYEEGSGQGTNTHGEPMSVAEKQKLATKGEKETNFGLWTCRGKVWKVDGVGCKKNLATIKTISKEKTLKSKE